MFRRLALLTAFLALPLFAVADATIQHAPSAATSFGDVTDTSLTVNGAATITGAATISGTTTLGGNLTFSSATIVDAYSDSFGAVTAGSTSTVTYTEVIDRLGEFVTSSFTAITAGYYEIIAHAGVSQTAGTACLIVKKNSTTITGGTVCNQGVTGLASILDLSFTRVLLLAANDVVRIDADAITANATFQKCTLTIKRLP